MKELSTREKILLGILAVVIVLFIYFKYIFSPVLDNIISTKSNIKKYKADISLIESTKILNEKQKVELEQLREQFLSAAMALPPIERNPEIIYNLKPLLDSNGIILNSASFGEPSQFTETQSNMGTQNGGNSQSNSSNNASKPVVEKLMAVPVNLSISGDYINIVNFISAVEKDKRIAEIGDVSISGGSNGKLQASVSISYFYADTANKGETIYEFNKGSYGKPDPFKQ